MDARNRALNYLNARMCSCSSMRDYLRRKGHDDEEIEPLIEELKEYHYLDDERYAIAFMEAGFEKGRGIERIRRELRQKGVDADTIAFAEDSVDIPDEFETALQIGEKAVEGIEITSLDYEEREKLKARIARRLAGRGYSSDVIYRVIGKLI